MLFTILFVLTDHERSTVDYLYLKYNNRMYCSAFKYLKNDAEAQDAVAHTYLNIIAHIDRTHKMPERPGGYCFTALENTVKVNSARIKARNEIFGYDIIADEYGEDTESIVFGMADKQRLTSAINSLPDSDKYLLYQRFYWIKTYKEIAQLLGVGEDAARKRIHKIVNKLRKIYDNDNI